MSGENNLNAEMLSALEKDTIGEIMNISMGSAATAASTLLNHKVSITAPTVEVVDAKDFDISWLEPAIAVEIKYVEGIIGTNMLIISKEDMRIILSQMMGTEVEPDFEISEMYESAICEMMNQMMGSSATVLSCFLGRNIHISTPRSIPIDGIEDFKTEYFRGETILTTQFNLFIQDVMESTFISAMEIDLAKEIIDVSLNFDSGEPIAEMPQAASPEPANETAASPAPETVPQAAPVPPPAAGAQQQQPQAPPYYPGYGAPATQAPYPPAAAGYEQPIVVKDYSFSDFGGGAAPGGEPASNLDLVMNVPVVVTVELGRTKRKIKEILEFGQGTIVELDKQAGSQVDVIVNGQMIAKGDVVVVDDNFSIRITEILKSRDDLML